MRITVLYSIHDRYNLTICFEKRSTISVNKINIRGRAKSTILFKVVVIEPTVTCALFW